MPSQTLNRIVRLETAMADMAIAVARLTEDGRARDERSEREIAARRDEIAATREKTEREIAAGRDKTEREIAAAAARLREDIRARDERSERETLAFKEEVRGWKVDLHMDLGQIANKQGRLVEDMVEPSIARVLRRLLSLPGDAPIAPCAPRFRARHPTDRSRMREFDIIAGYEGLALVVEVKSTLAPEQITKFAASLPEAREYLAPLGITEVMGAVASLRVDDSIVTHASRLGLVVLAVGEDLMVSKNAPGFVPRRV